MGQCMNSCIIEEEDTGIDGPGEIAPRKMEAIPSAAGPAEEPQELSPRHAPCADQVTRNEIELDDVDQLRVGDVLLWRGPGAIEGLYGHAGLLVKVGPEPQIWHLQRNGGDAETSITTDVLHQEDFTEGLVGWRAPSPVLALLEDAELVQSALAELRSSQGPWSWHAAMTAASNAAPLQADESQLTLALAELNADDICGQAGICTSMAVRFFQVLLRRRSEQEANRQLLLRGLPSTIGQDLLKEAFERARDRMRDSIYVALIREHLALRARYTLPIDLASSMTHHNWVELYWRRPSL